MDYDDARKLISQRNAGRCELCSLPGTDAHHRQTRRFASDCPCSLMWLCSGCHHDRVHGQPAAARGYGWIISRHAPSGAQFAPCWLPDWGWVRPTCTGLFSEAQDPN